jgi:hypothetical protein
VAWAGHDDARLRNATLERSHGSLRLLIRAKGIHAGDRVGVALSGDLRFVAAAPVGNRLRRWAVTPTSKRRRSLLNRAGRDIQSGRAVRGVAVIDEEPHLPDPVHGFTLRAFNERAVIAR